MSRVVLESVVRSASSSLSEALHWYWPAGGQNEIAERNLALHMSGALQRAGFHVYGEVSLGEDNAGRLDLVGMSGATKTSVIVECKRLINSTGAAGMTEDVRRIRRYVPRVGDEFWHPELPGYTEMRRFGIVAATTWNREYANWFLSGEERGDPSEEFRALWKEVGRGATWGADVIQSFVRPKVMDDQQCSLHWLVYCLFEL